MVKSPFLYLGVAAFLITLGVVFLINREERSFPLKQLKLNVFDENQYLFAVAKPGSAVIDLALIEGAVLKPVAPPFLVSGKTLSSLSETGGETKRDVEPYIVGPGENVSMLAQKFGISSETILWANNLSSQSVLQEGQKLVILPVSGVLHLVKQGDSINGLVLIYKAPSQSIIDFNGLSEEAKIFAGDFLIIPGGKKPKVIPKSNPVPLTQSYFLCPVPSPCRISQGLHWFNAVDFSNGRCGDPVYAAAGGEVQRTGYEKIAGNYVRIAHNNGVVTFYGHLSNTAVGPGDKVYQGQIIGYIGYSGLTIPKGPDGCHLHFDVRFAANPFAQK